MNYEIWIEAILGGVIVGISAAILLIFNGRIMGVSGISGTIITLLTNKNAQQNQPSEITWRLYFIAGLLLGGLILLFTTNRFQEISMTSSNGGIMLLSGILVGLGTRLGWGCTSGHGICGIGRFSGRSIIATAIFVGFGMITVAILKNLMGY